MCIQISHAALRYSQPESRIQVLGSTHQHYSVPSTKMKITVSGFKLARKLSCADLPTQTNENALSTIYYGSLLPPRKYYGINRQLWNNSWSTI